MTKSKTSPIVEVQNIRVAFGKQTILHDINLSIQKGEIVGIIGPNGCGKTTLLNSISGFVQPISGSIHIQKENINALAPYKRAQKYIGRSFQEVGVFKEMTVEENLMMIIEKEKKYPWWWMFQKSFRKNTQTIIDNTLEDIGLLAHKKSIAGILSGGQLRLLELARLQLSNRPVLLIDEPTAGVAPALRNKLAENIKKLSAHHGHTIIIVEHDLKFLFHIVHRVIVIVEGKKYLEGSPEQIQKDTKLQEVYFGSTD